ncbi:hypothetical protein CDL15_Pgr028951 [Punica granatum]|uniref:Uncharacterized protein n=1 Tax=Punica granatum TaxID=22663 RepID=A0A218WX76_PUNGR|nr:hypothetical protein CDL15_Pgr028951 [Punica granatum]
MEISVPILQSVALLLLFQLVLVSQPSLSRLKDQLLPKNPNIYHFSEIRATTISLSARRFF